MVTPVNRDLSTAVRQLTPRYIASNYLDRLRGAGVVTISGTGLGSKVSAAPYFYENFESYANGTLATAVGLVRDPDHSFASGTPYVDGTHYRLGSRSLRWDLESRGPGTQESFPAIGLNALNTSVLYQCWWQRMVRVSGTNVLGILKIARAGALENAGAGPGWYSGQPRFYSTHIAYTGNIEALACDTAAVLEDGAQLWTGTIVEPTRMDAWDFCEWEYVLDTGLGGRFVERINGIANVNRVGVQTATSSASRINGTYNMLGCDYGEYSAFSVYQDSLYVDKSLARVITTDNAVYASSTRFLPQICATWSDTGITFTPNTANEASLFVGGTVYDHVWAADGSYKSYQSRVI